MSEVKTKQETIISDKPKICKYCKHFDYYNGISVCYKGIISYVLGPTHVSPNATCKKFKYGKKQIENEIYVCDMWLVDVAKSPYNDYGKCPCISCAKLDCKNCDKFDMTNPICTKCLSCDVKTR